MIYITKIIRE